MNDFTRTIINGLKTYIQKSRGNWNQNDETAVDYIKNRTHWSEEKYIDIIPETTVSNPVTTTDEFNEFALTSEHIKEAVEFAAGKEYIVTWNGTEYKCIAKKVSKVGIVCLGNSAVTGGTATSEPFFIMPFSQISENGAASTILYKIAAYDGSTSFTFKVSGLTTVIHKIDKKYLPEISSIKNVLDGSAEGSVRTIETNTEIGEYAFAEGNGTTASGDNSHAEGYLTTASGYSSHAEGDNTTASGDYSHAEGNSTTAFGYISHAEGYYTTAFGNYSHAEGYDTSASGDYSHAEGYSTTASGNYSHAEGRGTTASGKYSHAEGYSTKHRLNLTGEANATTYTLGTWNVFIKEDTYIEYNNAYFKIISYSKNDLTITLEKTLSSKALNKTSVYLMSGIAAGDYSHAEGCETSASGYYSHAEGFNTTASGNYSHAEGISTTASSQYQHVQGRYNIEDKIGTYAHIVGNGKYNALSNAHTLDWEGNAWFQGDVYINSTSGKNKDEGSKKLATEEFVTQKVAEIDIETPTEYESIILKSSASGSTKKFRLTINDDGVLSAEEVIE